MASTLTRSCSPHLEKCEFRWSRWQQTILFIYKSPSECSKSTPNIVQSCQESTRAFVNPADLLGALPLPVPAWPSLIQSEEEKEEERSVPYMSSVQYNGTLWSESHWEQSLFRKHSAHSACLAMGQCNDTLLSPQRLGFIKRAGIKGAWK